MNTIGFPKLGLEWNIDPVAFSIGSKPVYWYALAIVTGFLLGVLFCTATCKKRGVSPDNVIDVGIYGLIAGLICARIYYVIFDWDAFCHHPIDIFKIWEGGLAIYGGIIGAVLSTIIYCKIKKLPVLRMFDVCAPGLFIGQAIGRYGNFFNAEVYGRETSSLLGMTINGGDPVHPLFFYESVWNIIGFLLLILLRDKKKNDGQVFMGYLFWYSAGRLVLEGMRQSQYILYVIPNVLGISQVVAAIAICLSAIGFIVLQLSDKKPLSPEAQPTAAPAKASSEISSEASPSKKEQPLSSPADKKDGDNPQKDI